MNFMFCCIDVNYVRNPKQEVDIFGLREKDQRSVFQWNDFREDIKKDDAAASAKRAQEDGYKMSTG